MSLSHTCNTAYRASTCAGRAMRRVETCISRLAAAPRGLIM